MIIRLPGSGIKGNTHAHVYEVLETTGNSIRVAIRLGTMDGTVFKPDPLIPFVERTIGGEAFKGFMAANQAAGAPAGEFRKSDVARWLGENGYVPTT